MQYNVIYTVLRFTIECLVLKLKCVAFSIHLHELLKIFYYIIVHGKIICSVHFNHRAKFKK